MAISVPVPKEITEYREKIMFGMSGRQLIFSLLAGVLAIGIGALCYMMGMDMSIIGYIIILAASPLMALGFIRKNNMPFEKYLHLVLRNKMGQNLLTYKTELLIDALPSVEAGESNTERNKKHGTVKKAIRTDKGGECCRPQSTAQSRKRKRQSALRKIKAARQEYRAAKRRAEAEAAGRSRP